MFSFSMQLPSNQKRNQITTVTTKPFIVPCKLAMLEMKPTRNNLKRQKKAKDGREKGRRK
jgi:hypothetical protein